MSVLIKGMTMPKCCDDCHLLYDCCSCIVTGYSLAMINWDSEHKRLPDCPIIELPDHGRLVNADEMERMFLKATGTSISFNGVPTVIPAERSEDAAD